MSIRTAYIGFILGWFIWILVGNIHACPFCEMSGKTFYKEIQDAKIVVYGKLANAQVKLNPDGTESSSTELHIVEVLKDHPYLKGRKVLILPRYLPFNKGQEDFLVFCDVYKDRLDPYRGMPVIDKDMVAYMRQSLQIGDTNIHKRLEFSLPYLDHADLELANDAYREFAQVDYKHVSEWVAKTDRAALRGKLIHWLSSEETPPYRYGLYGMLLGLVGKPEDAKVFEKLVTDPQSGLVTGMDGLMAGYIRAVPTAGWAYVKSQFADASIPFARRYSALQAIRFIWRYQPDVLTSKEIVQGLAPMLEQHDIADLVIDDLRKHQEWSLVDTILQMTKESANNQPQMKRSILKYMLKCPDAKAKAYVADVRKTNPTLVEQAEDYLKLEIPDP